MAPFICAALAVAGTVNPAWAQMPFFTTASLKGTCGFTQAASEVKSGDPHFLPQPAVGTLNFNGSGGVTLAGTQNQGGVISTLSKSGVYLVNPDGRTGTVDFSGAGGPVLSFVIVAGGQELRFINTGKVNPTSGLLDQVLVGQCDF